jgi:excisionase family DNA binding protein
MTAKLDYAKYDLEINDESLSLRDASEAIKKRTGDVVSHGAIGRERKRRSEGGNMEVTPPTVEQPETPKTVEQSTEQSTPETPPTIEPVEQPEIPNDDFTLVAEEPKRRGRPAKLSTEEAEARQKARYNAAGAVDIADVGEVEELKLIMDKMYSVESVAAALGCTVRAVQSYLKSGRLRGVKIAGNWRISAENFKAFIDGQ